MDTWILLYKTSIEWLNRSSIHEQMHGAVDPKTVHSKHLNATEAKTTQRVRLAVVSISQLLSIEWPWGLPAFLPPPFAMSYVIYLLWKRWQLSRSSSWDSQVECMCCVDLRRVVCSCVCACCCLSIRRNAATHAGLFEFSESLSSCLIQVQALMKSNASVVGVSVCAYDKINRHFQCV